MEMRTGGPEMAGAPRDLGQSPSTGQSIPTSEEHSARDARSYTTRRRRGLPPPNPPPSPRLWWTRRRPSYAAWLHQTAASGCLHPTLRRRSGFGGRDEGRAARATTAGRSVGFGSIAREKSPPIRFCETNPFHFRLLFDVCNLCTVICVVCSRVCKWVRSGKTNPFEGCFKVIHAVMTRNTTATGPVALQFGDGMGTGRNVTGKCSVLLGGGGPILDGYVISRTWS